MKNIKCITVLVIIAAVYTTIVGFYFSKKESLATRQQDQIEAFQNAVEKRDALVATLREEKMLLDTLMDVEISNALHFASNAP
jgi:hypothetical protein